MADPNLITDPEAANDDAAPPPDAIPFDKLVEASGLDEDTLLQRLARILTERSVDV